MIYFSLPENVRLRELDCRVVADDVPEGAAADGPQLAITKGAWRRYI